MNNAFLWLDDWMMKNGPQYLNIVTLSMLNPGRDYTNSPEIFQESNCSHPHNILI